MTQTRRGRWAAPVVVTVGMLAGCGSAGEAHKNPPAPQEEHANPPGPESTAAPMHGEEGHANPPGQPANPPAPASDEPEGHTNPPGPEGE